MTGAYDKCTSSGSGTIWIRNPSIYRAKHVGLSILPRITRSAQTIAQSSFGNRFEIKGSNFHSSISDINVALYPEGAAALGLLTVAHCSDRLLVVDVGTSTTSLAVGTVIHAVVTRSGAASNMTAIAVIGVPITLSFGTHPVLTNKSYAQHSRLPEYQTNSSTFRISG